MVYTDYTVLSQEADTDSEDCTVLYSAILYSTILNFYCPHPGGGHGQRGDFTILYIVYTDYTVLSQ